VGATIRLAALDHAAGNTQDAYTRLDAVLEKNATNLEALLAKATILEADGRLDPALQAAEAAAQAHPSSAAAFFLVGRLQAARGQTEAASTAYKNVLRLNPRATGAQLALSRLNLAAGRTGESVAFAEDALKGDPQNPNARLTLVSGLIASGDLRRAQTELTQLQQQFPKSPAVMVQQGMLLGRQRDHEGARRAFEAALTIEPAMAPAHAGLISVDLASGRRDAAIERARSLERNGTSSPDVLMVAARAYAAANDQAGAERLLREILVRDSGNLAAYAALAQLYMRQQRLDEALTELNAVAARDPRSVAARTLAGMILQAQGKTADARARFEEAVRIDASTPVAANNLAWLIAEEGGNLDVALELAQAAKRGLPASPEVSDTLGYVYMKKNLLPQAVREFRAAVEKEDGNAGYHHHLGLALAKSGDKEGALRHLSKALQLNASFPGADEARAVLKTLGS
jgi:tetratricopeptide (TPR) repeat protein